MVAKTLENILEHPAVRVALDVKMPVEIAYAEIMNYYKVDINKRNPRPSYKTTADNEIISKETDMDLFTFINELVLRNAEISIPNYKRMCEPNENPDLVKISDDAPNGKLVALVGREDALSFSIRIIDKTYMQKNPDGSTTIGVPRNYALVNHEGELRDCWVIDTKLNQKESNFIKNKNLSVDGEKLSFNYFVHPNKAFSFYGAPYMAACILSRRIKEEANCYRAYAKGIEEIWNFFVPREDILLGKQPFEYDTFPSYKSSIDVMDIETLTEIPGLGADYPILGITKEGEITETGYLDEIARYSKRRAIMLSYHYGPRINAIKRAIEYAFFKYGFYNKEQKDGNEIQPSWEKPEWIRDHKPKERPRTSFNALRLNDEVTHSYRIWRHKINI